MRSSALAWLALTSIATAGWLPGDRAVVFRGRVIDVDRIRPAPDPWLAGRGPASARPDVEGGGPAGVTVVVRRSVPGGGSRDETVTTGADGRFEVAFSAAEVAEPRLRVAVVRVEHASYVPQADRDPEGSAQSLSALIEARALGDDPSVGLIGMARGVERTGRFVEPDGRPAAGVPVRLSCWTQSAPYGSLDDDTTGRTDADGRFRIMTPVTGMLAVNALPDRLASYRHAWGPPLPPGPEAFQPPTDLGRMALGPGPELSGRLLDVAGRPLGGRTLGLANLSLFWIDRRTAVTDGSGRFRFGPLRPGNYVLVGQGQEHQTMLGGTTPADAAVFSPAMIYLAPGADPGPIEVREPETVRVEVRFVDSRGRPVPGCVARLAGLDKPDPAPDPNPNVPPAPVPARVAIRRSEAEQINGEEDEAIRRLIWWNAIGRADADGRVVFRAPRKLVDAYLNVATLDDLSEVRGRLDGGPPGFGGTVPIGPLMADVRRVEVTCLRVATVVVAAPDEDGEAWNGGLFALANRGDGTTSNLWLTQQADGRYRGRLVPGRRYEVGAKWSGSQVANRFLRLDPAEGERIERTLHFRTRPITPRVGDLAPAFLARGLDDSPVTLADFRGRHLLLHFWAPNNPATIPELRALITPRADDPRFSALGLILSRDPADAAGPMLEGQIKWPQALLRETRSDPAALDYGGGRNPPAFLIGPDGHIAARARSLPQGGWDFTPIAAALTSALGPAAPR